MPSLGSHVKLLIGISHAYPVGIFMLMLMTILYLCRPTMRTSTRIHCWTFVISAVYSRYAISCDCDLFLYTDNTCLLYQHKDLE